MTDETAPQQYQGRSDASLMIPSLGVLTPRSTPPTEEGAIRPGGHGVLRAVQNQQLPHAARLDKRVETVVVVGIVLT